MKITGLSVLDLRFPTSKVNRQRRRSYRPGLFGRVCHPRDRCGHRRTRPDVHRRSRKRGCAAAIEAFRHLVVGRALDDITSDFGGFWHSLAGESQLRWLGPEKGVIHLALAAVVNAVWDLYGKAEGKPVWKLLSDMTPAAARLVHRLPLTSPTLSHPRKRSRSSSSAPQRSRLARRSF